MIKGDRFTKHPCGAYFQHIAVDPITNFAAIPYREAQELGFFKIDFLHLSVLDMFESKAQIRKLMKIDPDWTLLNSQHNVEKLFHIKKHFELINKVKPTSVQELADVMALIRPNKKFLLDQYLNNRIKTSPLLYRNDGDDKSSFRRSHALAYSFNVVLQMHLIKQGLL